MKKVILTTIAAVALSGSAALAADLPVKARPVVAPPPPAWDIAFGGSVMTDYNFRGISQSNRGFSASAYVEPQFNFAFGTLYIGIGGLAIDWPSGPGYGFTAPSAEIDIYGGWRNTWGQFSLDLGVLYYYYPRESFNGVTNNSDFIEFYAKPSYAVTPDLTFGLTMFYTPDLLNYSESFSGLVPGFSADASAFYGSVIGKWVLPWKAGNLGAFISGELGHWWIDDSGFTNPAVVAAGGLVGTNPSYTYYNIGLAFTYKAITLDLRYHGTDQNVADCNSFLLVAPGNLSSNWCKDTFIGAIKFDTSINQLK
jgi:uncharacterized protein (TIGR02001 family)